MMLVKSWLPFRTDDDDCLRARPWSHFSEAQVKVAKVQD